jgi:hypothetical protein
MVTKRNAHIFTKIITDSNSSRYHACEITLWNSKKSAFSSHGHLQCADIDKRKKLLSPEPALMLNTDNYTYRGKKMITLTLPDNVAAVAGGV